MTRRLTRFGVAIVGLLVAGCTVGPNYVRPTLPTPDTIRGSQASTTVALGEAKWWEVFQDAELQALVRTALTQNEDLRIAAARILEAEAQLGITRADQYPTVTAEAAGGAARSTSSNSTPATTAGAVRVGATADWVLDFWGR
jgi:multidrug efflux system outer membrane protein